MFSLHLTKCALRVSQGKTQKVTLFYVTLSQTSKKFILRALINFHYVTVLLISIKKYLTIINKHPMISVLRANLHSQGSLRAVSGQSQGSSGQFRADFIWHRRFPCVGHIFLIFRAVSGQLTDNTTFNEPPKISVRRAHSGHSGHSGHIF